MSFYELIPLGLTQSQVALLKTQGLSGLFSTKWQNGDRRGACVTQGLGTRHGDISPDGGREANPAERSWGWGRTGCS